MKLGAAFHLPSALAATSTKTVIAAVGLVGVTTAATAGVVLLGSQAAVHNADHAPGSGPSESAGPSQTGRPGVIVVPNGARSPRATTGGSHAEPTQTPSSSSSAPSPSPSPSDVGPVDGRPIGLPTPGGRTTSPGPVFYPTEKPTTTPSSTDQPTPRPTGEPTPTPTPTPTHEPTPTPTPKPTPTHEPTPTPKPTPTPTHEPTPTPKPKPTPSPSCDPGRYAHEHPNYDPGRDPGKHKGCSKNGDPGKKDPKPGDPGKTCLLGTPLWFLCYDWRI